MYYQTQRSFGFGRGGITNGVKTLLIANGAVYFFQMLVGGKIFFAFGLVPNWAWSKFYIWQFFTYMFLHGNFFHILLNMYALWVFGVELERMWGTKAFYKYYFITGVGAGLIHTLITPMSQIPTIGASGAVMGVLTAYALMFPNRVITLLLFFIIPVRMRARTLALLFAGISLLSGISGSSDGIAHFAHLGGMLIGYLYIKGNLRFDWFKNKFRDLRRNREMNVHSRHQEEREKLKRLVDQVLDKANKVGFENLSKDEKLLLKKASKIFSKDE